MAKNCFAVIILVAEIGGKLQKNKKVTARRLPLVISKVDYDTKQFISANDL